MGGVAITTYRYNKLTLLGISLVMTSDSTSRELSCGATNGEAMRIW
jgi:hypothetical protein